MRPALEALPLSTWRGPGLSRYRHWRCRRRDCLSVATKQELAWAPALLLERPLLDDPRKFSARQNVIAQFLFVRVCVWCVVVSVQTICNRTDENVRYLYCLP